MEAMVRRITGRFSGCPSRRTWANRGGIGFAKFWRLAQKRPSPGPYASANRANTSALRTILGNVRKLRDRVVDDAVGCEALSVNRLTRRLALRQ